ncbi:MAG TPA: mevalonate kinase [Polyangiaceae bacterium]|nr:mevalonate kinase [Polyangiaceae bacterium]
MAAAEPHLDETWSRASGKVILFGEHAVVHGVRAIAAGISRGVRAHTAPAASDCIVVGDKTLPGSHGLYAALLALRQFLNLSPVALSLHSEIPEGSGLGSSAAMAVATARALVRSHGLTLSERALFQAAQSWEGVFHGNPSGVDVAAAQSGSTVGFVRGEEPSPLVLARPLDLVVVQAGPPESTKRMVELVAKNKTRNPVQFDKSLAAITALVENATLLLRQGDWPAVGKLMDLNHMLLAAWMLSTQDIERACNLARTHGALGAKLTGAGGGGCVIALAESPAHQAELLKPLQESSLLAFAASVGAPSNETR